MKKTIDILQNYGVILHLTDTTWGLAASCLSHSAVKKIYKVKDRPSHKPLILLVSSIQMLSEYVLDVSPEIKEIINESRPTTIIFDKIQNVPSYLIANDESIAIRVVKKTKLVTLIEELGHPLVSTSANLSGEDAPVYYSDINPKIIQSVDLAIPEEVLSPKPPSRIIKIEEGMVKIIRE